MPGNDSPHSPQSGRRRVPWRAALAASLLLLILGVYLLDAQRILSWDYLRRNLHLVQAWAEQNGAAALAGFFLLYTTVTALSLPVANVLSLFGGALFGRWLGTALVVPAASTGATLAMLSSRYLLRDFVRRRFGPRFDALDRGVRSEGAYYLFTLRLLPVFPFFLINLSMGLTAMRARTFFAVSLVGMMPGTFLYVNAGTALASLESPRDILSPTVLVSLA